MEEDVQALKGVNSHILNIFLNEGLERNGEADSIEGQNQEHQNNLKDIQTGRVIWPCLFIIAGCAFCNKNVNIRGRKYL